ncbi:MAG: helix-turn-helix transcriptional regulator [Chloroflexota bacterium]
MTKPASRLLTLILLLQDRPNRKAAELAEQLGISVRSLHRYFEMLDEMGIPVYSERGPYGGFSLVRGYKMPPLIFTPEEAVAVHLGTSLVGEVWGTLYQDAAQGALAKLDNVLPNEQRDEVAWASRSLATTGLHRADMTLLTPTLDKLRRAVREYRRVSMTYRSGSSPHPVQRELDPYALVHRWGWWYVIGHCHLRDEVRSFRVDRIEALNLTAQVFPAPTEFDIRQYLARDWQAQPQVRVKMRFVPEMAHAAHYNRSGWESLEEAPDGSVEVVFGVPDLTWAASTALAYGPQVTVLEPEELRRMVAEWAQAIAGKYTGKGTK